MGTVIALPSPVVAVSKVAIAGVTVTRIAVTRVAIVIAFSVTIPITVLYFVDIVSHLSSIRRSSVLSSVAEAPVHLYTNGPSINLQTAQEIDGILRNCVRFKTTDYPASQLSHHKAESTGLVCVFVNSHNHLLHETATAEEVVDPLFGSIEGNIADIHSARLLDCLQLIIQR